MNFQAVVQQQLHLHTILKRIARMRSHAQPGQLPKNPEDFLGAALLLFCSGFGLNSDKQSRNNPSATISGVRHEAPENLGCFRKMQWPMMPGKMDRCRIKARRRNEIT